MTTANDIFHALDQMAPFSIQMDFDNAGFLVGRKDASVSKVMVSLDITEEVIEEAARWGAQLIVSHHPLIFHPLRAVRWEEPVGRCVMKLISRQMGAICCHTNLDAVQGGVNDLLAGQLGLTAVEQLHQDGVTADGAPYGIGRVGILASGTCSMPRFLDEVKRALKPNGLRYHDAGRPVFRVAVGGGACADMMQDALKLGCDTFVTSDVKYNGFLDARDWGLNLIDAGHFPTEDVVCPQLEAFLSDAFPGLEVVKSRLHREVISYCV